VLGLATGSPESLDPNGKKLFRFADILNLLAHMTGGRYFWISSPNNVAYASGVIANELRHQYVLGFATAGTDTAKYREIEVVTRKKSLRLTFRRGYQGTAPKRVIAAAD
jgi:hypothetical protein